MLAYGWLGALLAIWVGLCVGSFLNVVIYRLPVMLERQWQAEARQILDGAEPDPEQSPFNLMVPRSRCPSCGTQILAWQNVPVVSWILLGGKCAGCSASIPIRYPVVEALTAFVSIGVLALFGFTWLGLAALLFTWILLALTFIDYDTQLLPDQLTLPLLWLGLITNVYGGFTDLTSAVVGAVAGYLFLWSTYWGFKLITGKEGMGYGDFKLLAAIGAWLGWQVLPATVLIAAGVGLIYAVLTGVAGKRESAQPIPFGPFLAIAGWVCMVERDTVLRLFLS
ncbi:MAG: prepilin peptidase [Gammaproteobacteria bacterium]|nr:prepilin peptidase [Gammaproteobacteria bacterium]